jgi:hypothetical protein
MKFLALTCLVALVSSDHTGHDHSALKPSGPFYGLYTQKNRAGTKEWNAMELAIYFKENTFDIKWWYGAKAGIVDIDKQVFDCQNVPFTFDEAKLRLVIKPDDNECLRNINSLFPKGWGLTSPYYIRVDHDKGDLTFGVAQNIVRINLYAVDQLPANIPSGENGLAPVNKPARRSKSSNADANQNQAGPAGANSPTKPPVMEAAGDVSSPKSATAKVGSVIVSTAAIILAGLFL